MAGSSPLRLHHPPRRVVLWIISWGAGALQQGGNHCWVPALQGPCFLGNLLSLFRKPLSSAVLGPATLPYVGCLCSLHDPSHINVIIRASIYTGFLLSSNSSCLAGRDLLHLPCMVGSGILPILCSGHLGVKRLEGEKCGRDEREGPDASHFQSHEAGGG